MPLLECAGLGVQFGGLAAVQGLDLELEAGQILSVIGPNGAGKTTLFNLITGFVRPSAGWIGYKGQEITGRAPHRVARQGIIRTFQKTEIFPEIPVLEGVRIATLRRLGGPAWGDLLRPGRLQALDAWSWEIARDTLDLVGLRGKEGVRGRDLAYGEQRLLEVAQALAAQPEVLLLDEPASGMTPEESRRVMDLIARLRDRGITIMVVEHNMRVVMNISDRIVVLNHGQKIAEGSPTEIREDPEVIKAYLGERYARA